MVDCALDVISHDIAERSDATVVFRISTPWLPSSSDYHRTLLGPARKSRKLPVWAEEDFLKYLGENRAEGAIMVFVEVVYSNAGTHELLKQTSMKHEKLVGMGSFNAFNNIMGISREEIIRAVELKDVLKNTVVGTLKVKFTSVLWPRLQQKLWGKSKSTLHFTFEGLGEKFQKQEDHRSPTPTKKNDFDSHYAKLYNESPDSPLMFPSDTEGMSEKQFPLRTFGSMRSRSIPVKQTEEGRSSPLSPSQILNRQKLTSQHNSGKSENDAGMQQAKGDTPPPNVSRRLAANFNAESPSV